MDVAIIDRRNIVEDIQNIHKDYVLILDTAEKVDRNVLDKYNDKDDADIIIFDYVNIYQDSFVEIKKANTYNLSSRQMIKPMLSGQYSACLRNKIFRKSLLSKINDTNISDFGKYLDLAICIESFSLGCKVKYVSEVLSSKKIDKKRTIGGTNDFIIETIEDIRSYDLLYKKICPLLCDKDREFLYDIVAKMKNGWVSDGLIKRTEFNRYASIPLRSLMHQPWSRETLLLYVLSYLRK